MKTLKITKQIQMKVLEYLSKKLTDIDTMKDLDMLLELLSPSLKHIVTQHMFLSALNSINIFANIPDLVDYLVYNIEAIQFMPEDFIIKQG